MGRATFCQIFPDSFQIFDGIFELLWILQDFLSRKMNAEISTKRVSCLGLVLQLLLCLVEGLFEGFLELLHTRKVTPNLETGQQTCLARSFALSLSSLNF